MQILPICLEALVCLLLSLLLGVRFCYGEGKTVEVAGIGECADCAFTKIEPSKAFSGLRVTIDCKNTGGVFKTRGTGEFDGEGKFKAYLPAGMVKDGELKEECFAQLHSLLATPCPAHNGLESSKIVFKSYSNGKHTFCPSGKLKFSPGTCTSAFLWPFFKYPTLPTLPPMPNIDPWKKPFPKVHLPPLKSFGHPLLPFPPKLFPPKHKKILPPLLPVPKPKPPIPKILPPPVPIYKKPCPPSVPIYKPKPPIPKILPPPVPIYKKPCPPSVPIYKPKPPIFKTPPIPKTIPPHIPIHKPKPPFLKTLPPLPKIPPIHKKPCPPIPKIPSLPKLPPFPKIPHKHFHHPKFGHFPPIPPFPP